tara:strand:+ start:507 stop:1268 length:762 start_codon:yes stop_codon:yes gene_type:complete
MARQAPYIKTLLTAREEAEQRLGPAYKFRGAIVDLDDDASKLSGSALVPRRQQTEEEMDDDFLGSTFNRIYADNRSLSDVLQGEGTSTRAMTIDGKPVNMLNRDVDVGKLNVSEYGKKLFQDVEETLGLEPFQAAAIVGNFDHETGGFKFMKEINPTVKGSKGGQGIAMWTASRRDAFLDWSKKNNLNPNSYEANSGFFFYETQYTREGKFLEELQKTKTVEEATKVVSEIYLRPGKPMLDRRIALSKSYLEV